MMLSRALSRRTFLSVSAAAGFAALRGGSANASGCLNIGVIGCGQRGIEILTGLMGRADVHVAGVSDICRPRREAAAALCRAKSCPAWQDLVTRDDLDAVVIATPDHWHAPMAIAAMQAGKDVYCEPPMALNAEDAKAFRDCAHATGRIVQIGAHEPFEGQWCAARELVRLGRLGKIRRCHAARSYNPILRTPSDSAVPHAGDLHWSHHWSYSHGAAANDLFGMLAAFLLATGLECPARVSAAGGIYEHDGREVPDSLMLTVFYPDGPAIVLATSPVRKTPQSPVIRGERASLFCEDDGLRLVPQGAPDSAGMPIPTAPNADPMTNWLDCLRTRRQPVCNVDLSYYTTLTISMAVEAYRRRKTASLAARETRTA